VIQHGGRQVRYARLTGAAVSDDVWNQLTDVQRLDIEDAGDDLMESLSRHAFQFACLEALFVTWTPMKVAHFSNGSFVSTLASDRSASLSRSGVLVFGL